MTRGSPHPRDDEPILETQLRYIDWVPNIPRPRRLVLATDATGLHRGDSTSSIGFIYSHGLFGFAANPNPISIVGRSRITIGELRAVHYALLSLDRYSPNDNRRPITLLCDSQAAIRYLEFWRAGQLVYPRGYSLEVRHNGRQPSLVTLAERLAAHPSRLLPTWTAGHPTGRPSHPLNHAAHQLARLGYGLEQQRVSLERAIKQAKGVATQALVQYIQI